MKDISQVSVIDKEKEGQKYLAAYYVIAKDKKAPEIDDLRDLIYQKLYLITWCQVLLLNLDEMPLTPKWQN